MASASGTPDRSSFQIVLATKLSEPVLRSLPVESAEIPATTVFELTGDRINDVMDRLTARGHQTLSIRVCHRRELPAGE